MPLPEDATLWSLAALGAAVLIIGIAKAGFGGGVAIVAVPLTAAAMPPERAIGVLLPLLIAADLFANAAHFRHQSGPHLKWLLVGGITGIVAGTAVMLALQERGLLTFALNLMVGSICLFFVAVQCYRLLGGSVPRIPPGPVGGHSTGLVAGLTSTIAHSAGPIVSIYLLEQRMEKRLLVGTMVLFFLIVNVAKLPTYFGMGLINPSTLWAGLWTLPLIPVGVWLGLWMHKRIPEKPFVAVMYLGAAAAAGNMLYRALAG